MESTLAQQPNSMRAPGWRRLAIPAAIVFLLALLIWMIISRNPATAGQPPAADPQAIAAFEAATGLRLSHVAVIGGGGLIDVRYQVIDPDKALIVFDREQRPTIVDEATGTAASTPWMDHSHAASLRAGQSYYLVLSNPGGVIKPGRAVSVVIGDLRLEHVTVQ
jgi:hypothetical protein